MTSKRYQVAKEIRLRIKLMKEDNKSGTLSNEQRWFIRGMIVCAADFDLLSSKQYYKLEQELSS